MSRQADRNGATTASRTPAGNDAAHAPEDVPLEQRTRQQLYTIARTLEIPGRSRMTKQQLILAIRDQR